MAETNNTIPAGNAKLKAIPDNVKNSLTQEQYNEVIRAQQTAASKAAGERLAVLRSEISSGTQTKLQESGVKLEELAEEKSMIDSAQEMASNAYHRVENFVTNAGENFSAN